MAILRKFTYLDILNMPRQSHTRLVTKTRPKPKNTKQKVDGKKSSFDT